MRISHRHRFIFFSNPKTGSESVRLLLDPYTDIAGVPFWEKSEERPFYSHMRPVEARELFRARGWDFDGYFKFTFVRNPWARLVSLYEMIYGGARRGGLRGRVLRFARESLGLHPSRRGFRSWLPTTRPDGPGAGGPPDQRWRVYGTYSIRAFVTDEEGNELVDRIIKLEEIGEALPAALEAIGLEAAARNEIPRTNVGRRARYPVYYDDEAADLVARRYAHDIERFGYRFGA